MSQAEHRGAPTPPAALAGLVGTEVGVSRWITVDQARIDDVVAKVLTAAQAHHLSPEIAEPVWRLLIDRCIAHEFAVYDRTRS